MDAYITMGPRVAPLQKSISGFGGKTKRSDAGKMQESRGKQNTIYKNIFMPCS